MEFDAFKLEREDSGLVTLTLDRPERLNALTFESYRQLCEFFRREQQVSETRAIILAGSGRGFCSGGDVHDIIGALRDAGMKRVLEFAWMTGELIKNMRELDRPIIAAVHGTCAGAGAVMALASDFRVLGEGVGINLIFSKVGLTGADMGAAYLLPRLVGTARATEILMLGGKIAADDARSWGLANAVVPREEVGAEARRWAGRILEAPPFATRVTKRMLHHEWSMDLSSAIEAEALAQALMMLGEDHTEFYRAFSEKRPPNFKGE